jgi:hypothetical protein
MVMVVTHELNIIMGTHVYNLTHELNLHKVVGTHIFNLTHEHVLVSYSGDGYLCSLILR